jgi:hypothetical protein
VKLPAHRAGLAGHLQAKPVDKSPTRIINLPHLSFDIHSEFAWPVKCGAYFTGEL